MFVPVVPHWHSDWNPWRTAEYLAYPCDVERPQSLAPLDDADPLITSVASRFGGLLSVDEILNLQSKPDSNFTIYLDFDGHVTEGTSWNSSYGIDTIVTPPFDLDGNPSSFGPSELDRMLVAWQRTAEDFAPFDINVTTREPDLADLIRSGGGDTRWGARAVITDDVFANCGCGGHAYIDSFNDPTDTPTFVYNQGEGSLGETISHEVGHMLNLFHDGTSVGGLEYYRGHGTGTLGWGPIMGAPFDQNVTQWDRGQYYDANNSQNDLSDITSLNGFTIVRMITGTLEQRRANWSSKAARMCVDSALSRHPAIAIFYRSKPAPEMSLSLCPP